MQPADKMRRLFDEAAVTTNRAPDEAFFETLEQAYTETTETRSIRRDSGPWRGALRSPVFRLACAAAVVVLAIVGIEGLSGLNPAFADVVRPLLMAQTAAFKVVVYVEGEPTLTMDGQFMDPGLGRHTVQIGDNTDSDNITIMDYVQGQGIVLIPSQRAALVIELENRSEKPDPSRMNAFRELRQRVRQAQENPPEAIERLGESVIGGHRAVGYRIVESDSETAIWFDPKSFLPVQVEHVIREETGPPIKIVMMDIEFDVPFDRRDFSIEIPDGYTARTMQADASPSTEADLVAMLAFYAEKTDGEFPSTLGWMLFKDFGKCWGVESSPPMEESTRSESTGQALLQVLQTLSILSRGVGFVADLADDTNWRYAGAQAEYGDSATPIFWYHPADSATYRVIYADLTVRDITREALAVLQNGPDP